MMREPNMPEDAKIIIVDVGMEIYLRYRDDPINLIGTFQFNAGHLDADDLLESFMGIVTHTCKGVLNSRDELRFVLSDRNSNKFMIEAREVQAISLLAPSIETISEAVESNRDD